MTIIKRLYIFILQTFLPLFAMTFFIVLFIVLMQFLWRYIDDLIGKGLSMDVLFELFFYAAVSMVPMALPLAVLLASLMTFGNLGEKFELTAMKASGISLLKVMRPLIVLISLVAVGAFFFQNDILPKAQVKMWTLLFSMREKSPELEIPEGVFYDQIPGYNLFVKQKDRETGMLRDVMIYATGNGTNQGSTILLADSARLAMTKGNKYLFLHLYAGEQFENLRQQNIGDNNVPFRRETFLDKKVLIPFNAGFTRFDEQGMRNQYVGKNLSELRHTIDSVSVRIDSMGILFDSDLRRDAFPSLHLEVPGKGTLSNPFGEETNIYSDYPGGEQREIGERRHVEEHPVYKAPKPREIKSNPLSIDSLVNALPVSVRNSVYADARSRVERQKGELEFRAVEMSSEKKTVRRHGIELLKKFTLSVACIIFFFIGAPLGAIIRKGGLGTPLVISVLLFLVYYIIDNTGYKMARDGHLEVWVGMWLSTFILAPLSIYVTWKAMNDSSVFDKDCYLALFRTIFGIRPPRSVPYKEVIINDISLNVALNKLAYLEEDCNRFLQRYKGVENYKKYWLKGYNNLRIKSIAGKTDELVEYLSDCRNLKIIDKLGEIPNIGALWIYQPGIKQWIGITAMIVFPVGLPLYFIGINRQRRLKNNLEKIVTVCKEITEILSVKE